MNLVLLEPDEFDVDAPRPVRLRGRRARHLLDVVRVTPGTTIRVGRVDGPAGTAVVTATATEPPTVTLERVELTIPTRPRGADVLVLAIPRPRVLARCLEHATALGFGRILLTRTWRVDKSHLGASVLAPDAIARHVAAGLEMAAATTRPEVETFARFRPFVEDELPRLATSTNRFVADAHAAHDVVDTGVTTGAPFTLVIGPERGLIPWEIDLLTAHGFTAIRGGSRILRVETAVAALHGQLRARRGGECTPPAGTDPGRAVQ